VDNVRELVCSTGKELLRRGLVFGTWGNVSCRVDKDFMIITPSGRDYLVLTPEDMVLVNINNLSHEAGKKPSSEKNLHAQIYKSRREINAIIHIHSQNASTVAAARREVPPLLDDMAQVIGPSIKVAEYAIPGTVRLANYVVRALAGRNAVLLANHGAVCVGRNMDEALVVCEILEKSCRTFIESEFLGGGIPLKKVDAFIMHQYFLRKYSREKNK